MKNNNKTYKLVHYSFCNLIPRNVFDIRKVYFDNSNGYFAYIEEYSNINLVESRILELNSEWRRSKTYQKAAEWRETLFDFYMPCETICSRLEIVSRNIALKKIEDWFNNSPRINRTKSCLF